jgi:hypothetical protein
VLPRVLTPNLLGVVRASHPTRIGTPWTLPRSRGAAGEQKRCNNRETRLAAAGG